MKKVKLTINGVPHTLDIDDQLVLLDLLRDKLLSNRDQAIL